MCKRLCLIQRTLGHWQRRYIGAYEGSQLNHLRIVQSRNPSGRPLRTYEGSSECLKSSKYLQRMDSLCA